MHAMQHYLCRALPRAFAFKSILQQRLDRRHQLLVAVRFKIFIDNGMDLVAGNSFCIWRQGQQSLYFTLILFVMIRHTQVLA